MTEKSRQFEQIYRDVSRDLYVYIVRSIRNDDLAGDILQDSFINFIKAFQEKDLPPSVNCRMYLFRIARHLMINHSRSSVNKKTTLYSDPDSYVSSSSENLPESNLMESESRKEVSNFLNELLSNLSEEEKTAVILKHVHQMKLAQIAEILETSVSTASRLVQKGMERLSEMADRKGVKLGEF
ncbi:MAG: sigma-70 family RNA polymerase sigma factor [Spirochaetia bacterium]|nr:sigma-70 family RNA polymerase sigma factor [Spirochaetia bacterium]